VGEDLIYDDKTDFGCIMVQHIGERLLVGVCFRMFAGNFIWRENGFNCRCLAVIELEWQFTIWFANSNTVLQDRIPEVNMDSLILWRSRR
jgi:hypothetical protein